MPFEYQTICKPDNFWPFEYQTSPVFRWLLYFSIAFCVNLEPPTKCWKATLSVKSDNKIGPFFQDENDLKDKEIAKKNEQIESLKEEIVMLKNLFVDAG